MAKLAFPNAAARAEDAWQRIHDKPAAVTLERGEVTLDAQTVRIEYSLAGREVSGGVGETGLRDVTVFGVQDHPTVDDTDIRRNDRFTVNGTIYYRVVDVIASLGEIQAQAEAIS